jgi:hypothetical protein
MSTRKHRKQKRKTKRGGDLYMGMGIMVVAFGIVIPFLQSKFPSLEIDQDETG